MPAQAGIQFFRIKELDPRFRGDERECGDEMIIRVSLIAALIVAVLATPVHAADAAFRQWLTQQWPAAQALGVSRATFDTATRGLEPDLSLPDLAIPGQAEKAPQQPEFVQTPSQYLR